MAADVITRARLEELVRIHENIVAALRMTLTLLDSEAAARAMVAEPVREQRQRTAALLDTLSPTEPRPLATPKVAGPLSRRGYIKRKGDGYVRTSKPFAVKP